MKGELKAEAPRVFRSRGRRWNLMKGELKEENQGIRGDQILQESHEGRIESSFLTVLICEHEL